MIRAHEVQLEGFKEHVGGWEAANRFNCALMSVDEECTSPPAEDQGLHGLPPGRVRMGMGMGMGMEWPWAKAQEVTFTIALYA